MDRAVIVTGGAQGIGKGIVLHLLRQGYDVIMADMDLEAGEEAERELVVEGRVLFVPTDVSDEDSARNCVERTVEHLGRLDAVVNNAGIARHQGPPVHELPLEQWERMIATNLTGAFLMTKHAAPRLRSAGGAIVNIASTRAVQSERNTEAYSASKGGLLALTHALAISLGPEIRVNAVSPGWIDTTPWKKSRDRETISLRPEDHAQHPVGRVGTPEDIAAIVEFLISDGSGFITGQNFIVDGGMTRKMIYAE